MNQPIEQHRDYRRYPWLAALLSVAAPGLGHVYCGRLTKGLVIFFVGFAFAPVISAASKYADSMTILVTIFLTVILIGAVFIYAVVDAFISARRIEIFQPKEYNSWPVYILFIIVAVTYPTNVASTFREHVLKAYKIPSTSMAPSVLPGDRIFLNKAVYNLKPPHKGDVVVFTYPDDRRLNYIKRIVAAPGDTIEIRNNILWINDNPLTIRDIDPPLLNFEPKGPTKIVEESNGAAKYAVLMPEGAPINMEKITVPHGYCFVLGDHRSRSVDSRNFGPVPLADVKGRLDYIYWPALSWERFGRYLFNG